MTARARAVRAVLVTVAVIAIAAAAVVFINRRNKVGAHAGEPPVQPSTTPPTDSTVAAAPTKPALVPIGQVAKPVALAVRPGDTSIYVNEQDGRIRRITVTGGGAGAGLPSYQLDDAPFLDIAADVKSAGEQGMLGLAFSPDGNRLYVAFTNVGADQELDEVSLHADRPDLSTRRQLLVIADFAPNHNGGQLVFGPDGFLYWSMGDGGGAGDPRKSGQDPRDLLGDILRIDPSKSDGATPYAIPADNPFADGNGGAPEVFAYGLRNPWRFSFDRSTQDLWIADVGQGTIEEIDFAPAGHAAGMNFGWSQLEGTHPFNGTTNPDGATLPVYEYDHATTGGCSVTGGFVYRGNELASLTGSYLFGDYCVGQLFVLRRAADGSVSVTDLGLNVPGLSSFGEDADGNLYALSLTGTVSRLTAA